MSYLPKDWNKQPYYTKNLNEPTPYKETPEDLTFKESIMRVPEEVDWVNHPNHYNPEGGRETLDYMEFLAGTRALIIHCTLNAVKYRDRAYKKENPKQDYEKAEFYMKKADSLRDKLDTLDEVEGTLRLV